MKQLKKTLRRFAVVDKLQDLAQFLVDEASFAAWVTIARRSLWTNPIANEVGISHPLTARNGTAGFLN